jgi:hypothetical protein
MQQFCKLLNCNDRSKIEMKPQSSNSPETLKKLLAIIIFSLALGYIDASVVVYLRAIFFPNGFVFPLFDFGVGPLWQKLLPIEAGREIAMFIVIFTAACLSSRQPQQRFAYFLLIFASWDIFYYLWLKILTGWPTSVMDWDILFLMPTVWASPVLAPLIVSLAMIICAAVILYRCSVGRPLQAALLDLLGAAFAGFITILSFCIAGQHIAEPDFRAYFHWELFIPAVLAACVLFLKACYRKQSEFH